MLVCGFIVISSFLDISLVVFCASLFSNNEVNNPLIKLSIVIWTDGSISPHDSLIFASHFINGLFTSLLENKEAQKTTKLMSKKEDITINPHTSILIEELQLSLRAYNCLKRAQILTLADLSRESYSSLLALRNFGQKSAEEVAKALETYGIELVQEL
jgi:DNA-directed RNA polymerase subunit alpha